MSPSSKGPKVLIIGAGIAGPITALLLKRKGYHPIVLEKVHSLGAAGSSLMLFPNGLKVLSLLNLSAPITSSTPNLQSLVDISFAGTEIGRTDLPSTFAQTYSQPAGGVKRSVLNLALTSALSQTGIPLIEGWKLSSIIETESGVRASSADGRIEDGSFLIGCDGIRSVVRRLLLLDRGIEGAEPLFTGLVQIAGISRTPDSLSRQNANPSMLNFYSPDKHLITYPSFPVGGGMTGWAVTQRAEKGDVETWQSLSAEQLVAFKEKLRGAFEGWCEPVRDLIEGAEKVIRYGLYDRGALEPENWVSMGGRAVLVGDAAHPTSPHLGQGANQALEDCWHLANLLPDVEGGEKGELGSEELRGIFREFAEKRAPRTEMLVKGARIQGERRVVGGGEEGRVRDEILRDGWRDKEAVGAKWDGLLREPFDVGV